MMNILKRMMDISDEVSEALKNNLPIVALESTIISHGMPYPKNVETALNVENIVRENGATPATIAIINGKIKVGLSHDEIDYLGKKGQAVTKVSRRDLPIVLAKKMDGATTVAATMIIAELSGIQIFATGGVGGVHRGAASTMDISADLDELANTSVLVVCAGVKSILDIGLTLEYLETKGVAVLGYQTEDMPAFYTTKSGFKVDYKVDTAKEVADIFINKLSLNLKGGVLLVNPIPPKYALDYNYITNNINLALVEADLKGIKGKLTTPFLLEKIVSLTGGASLEANIQLVYNNAKIAAEVAKNMKQ